MLACRAALQGGPAGEGAAEGECAAAHAVQARMRGIDVTVPDRGGTDGRTAAIQRRPKPKKVDTAAVFLAGKLDDRAAPYTVPMKAVPPQCGPLGRPRPAPRLVRGGCMERPARLFLCARCRVQVVLCSRCDRGNRYCGRSCWRQTREATRREAASRYQRSRRGRMAHSARSRRWRQRHAGRGGSGGGEQNVTHQGSQPAVAAAPLAAWTHDTASIRPDATAAAPAPLQPVPTAPWYCRRCGAPQPAWLRQGFLRHGRHGAAPAGRRHDAGP